MNVTHTSLFNLPIELLYRIFLIFIGLNELSNVALIGHEGRQLVSQIRLDALEWVNCRINSMGITPKYSFPHLDDEIRSDVVKFYLRKLVKDAPIKESSLRTLKLLQNHKSTHFEPMISRVFNDEKAECSGSLNVYLTKLLVERFKKHMKGPVDVVLEHVFDLKTEFTQRILSRERLLLQGGEVNFDDEELELFYRPFDKLTWPEIVSNWKVMKLKLFNPFVSESLDILTIITDKTDPVYSDHFLRFRKYYLNYGLVHYNHLSEFLLRSLRIIKLGFIFLMMLNILLMEDSKENTFKAAFVELLLKLIPIIGIFKNKEEIKKFIRGNSGDFGKFLADLKVVELPEKQVEVIPEDQDLCSSDWKLEIIKSHLNGTVANEMKLNEMVETLNRMKAGFICKPDQLALINEENTLNPEQENCVKSILSEPSAVRLLKNYNMQNTNEMAIEVSSLDEAKIRIQKGLKALSPIIFYAFFVYLSCYHQGGKFIKGLGFHDLNEFKLISGLDPMRCLMDAAAFNLFILMTYILQPLLFLINR